MPMAVEPLSSRCSRKDPMSQARAYGLDIIKTKTQAHKY